MSIDLQSGFVTVDGAHLHYYRTPPNLSEKKPVIILQHGFSDNGLCWGPVVEELAPNYDILMPDARGHGLSARVQRGQAVDQTADLAAVIQALEIESAIIVGHSMGAQIAGNLGARFPKLVRALILEDPPWFLPAQNNNPPVKGISQNSPYGLWLISIQGQSLEQVMAHTRLEHPNWSESYIKPVSQGSVDFDINFLAIENITWGTWMKDVSSWTCPALLLNANPSLGGLVTPELTTKVAELNPKVQFHNFPETGHHIHFVSHESFMRSVNTFLAELE